MGNLMKTVVRQRSAEVIAIKDISLDMDSIVAYKCGGYVYTLVALFTEDCLVAGFHGEAAEDNPQYCTNSIEQSIAEAVDSGEDVKCFTDRKEYHRWAAKE